jgi:hypothetical protein
MTDFVDFGRRKAHWWIIWCDESDENLLLFINVLYNTVSPPTLPTCLPTCLPACLPARCQSSLFSPLTVPLPARQTTPG